MDKIKEQLRNPIATAIVAFVIGLIVGLPILGWGLWPVQWINADPSHLREDYKQEYLCLVIDSFARRQDAAQAVQRFEALGEDGKAILDGLRPGTCALSEGDINSFRAVVMAPAMPLPGETPAATPPPAAGGTRIGMVIGLCLVTLIVGAGLVYLLVLRKRPVKTDSAAGMAQDLNRQAVRTDYSAQGQEQPINQFMTTYMVGDDLYDDSFSIDSPTGEFLGECGVGISETIGVGDPKKVTAFEVWLFDKNDIQTITKVLMTPHAFNDPAILQRLESKGEPIQVEKERRVLLETATLQLEARVVDLVLGGGALPENSFFERLTLELAVWPKTQA
ncbi:MAG: hypothetical protein AB1453_02405 [Chloroflexota bacterium]|jgi:hypothetical protein